MKKILIFFIIIYVFLLCGCSIQNTKQEIDIIISKLPNKVEYTQYENINFEGLEVKLLYDDNSEQIITNYEIIHNEYKIGINEIIIKYKLFQKSFNIYINELQRENILSYDDFSNYTIEKINLNNYKLKLDNVLYGQYRDTNTLILYDENNFVNTNIYGYEISCDEYGYVVDKNTNVNLEKNGFILSGHGTMAKVLKNINIGDICINHNGFVLVYDNNNIDERNKVYLKLKEVSNSLENINDTLQYNNIVKEINILIPKINNLKNNDKENIKILYNELLKIENKLNFNIYENKHKYSYYNINTTKLDNVQDEKSELFNFINYNEKLYYGGFRNQDTLVYYDKDNLIERNPYGYEVAVDQNNKIIEIATLVNLPENGYILSGHGSGKQFIEDNLTVGNIVKITSECIKFYMQIGTLQKNELINKRNEAVQLLNQNIKNCIPHDYEYINNLLINIDNTINSINNINNVYDSYMLYKNYNKVEQYLILLYTQLIDYEIDGTRGMWYYPFLGGKQYDDTSYEGVINTLNKLQNMGINEIILLPFYRDYCLYDSSYFYKYDKLDNYDYKQYGNDYLQCFIEEAHKRNILVNAFTQTFRNYEEGSKVLNETHYQVDYNGNYSKGNILYYDICNDYVQSTLINWYKELVTKYNFDKIEYDIIRYSASNLHAFSNIDIIPDNKTITDPGYTQYSMNKFKQLYNIEGDLKTLIKNSVDVRNDWLLFKENELIKFITNTTEAIKQIKPNIIITAAVMSDYESAKNNYLQDYKKWLELGIVDEIEPMVYSSDFNFVKDKIDYYNNTLSQYTVRIGIGNKATLYDICKQVVICNNNGYVLFSSTQYLKQSFIDVFSKSFHLHNISNNNSKEEIIINDLIDKIINYYQVKNNCNYDNLIDSLKNKNYDLLLKQLNNISDNKMADYIKNIINNI